MKALLFCLALVSSVVAFAHDDGRAGSCAYVYSGSHFQGASMTVDAGTFAPNLNRVTMDDGDSWNNKISSIYVKPGCQMVAYQYDNFGRHYRSGRHIGVNYVYTGGHYPYLGYMSNLISSYTCHCQ